MEYRATVPDALKEVQHVDPEGTERGSARRAERTEPDDRKVLKEVQSNSTENSTNTDTALFEEAWKAFPRRPNNSKTAARKAWTASVKRGADPEQMVEGTRRYAAYVEAEKMEPRFVKQAATFFGPGEWWLTDYTTDSDGDGAGEKVTTWDESTMGKFK